MIDQNPIPFILLAGPTAVGKTSLSLEIAEVFQCEIVSVDSMQVYRYMDIGTAKASKEERERVPHHLIDIVEPDDFYDAARFIRDCNAAMNSIVTNGKLPLLTGGTGLYYSALINGLFSDVPADRELRVRLQKRLEAEGAAKLHEELSAIDRISAERIHKNDTRRVIRALEIYYTSGIPWSEFLSQHKASSTGRRSRYCGICLMEDREILYTRINKRCAKMLEQGLEQEVSTLLEKGYSASLQSMQSIGYKHLVKYLQGDWSWDRMLELFQRDTRRYAKRQLTWFKKMEGVEPISVNEKGKILDRIAAFCRELKTI